MHADSLADKIKLPRWRYYIREKLLPIVRYETPYVAWLQSSLRSPFLDSYFAMTANLGTHTFFMVMLPILFWCGYTSLGRGYVSS
jgi:dihydrosphingosine 1-phosphate phosphatase